MAHQKQSIRYRHTRLRVEPLETRRLLAVLNAIPTLDSSANDVAPLTFVDAPTFSLEVNSDVISNGLVINYPSLDISANQGVFWVNSLSDADYTVLTVNRFAEETNHTVGSILGIKFFDTSDDGVYSNQVIVDGIPDTHQGTGVTFSPYQGDDFSLEQFVDTDLQSVADPLMQVEPNHRISDHIPTKTGPVRFPPSPLAPTQAAVSSIQSTVSHPASSVAGTLDSAIIDIADNELLTSFKVATPVVDKVSAFKQNENLAASENQTGSAEVAFRVEPVMARHHRIELPRETTTPRVTELPRDLPRETATPLVSTQLHKSDPNSVSRPTRISGDFRPALVGYTNRDQLPTAEAVHPVATTSSAVQQSVFKESNATSVQLISEDKASRGDDAPRSKWQAAIDVLMAATAGAIIYSQRERNTADRPSEFRLR